MQSLFTLTSTPLAVIAAPKAAISQRKTGPTISAAHSRPNKTVQFAVKPQGFSQRAGVSMRALPEQKYAFKTPRLQQIKSGRGIVMSLKATSGTKEAQGVPNLKSVQGPNLLDKDLQNSMISAASKMNMKQPRFVIENSSISSKMNCMEQVDGDIACELPEEEQCFSFDVEQLAASKYDDPNYFGHEFDEKYIYQFPSSEQQKEEEDDFGAFAGVIAMAVVDYDKFNFALQKFVDGTSMEVLRKFMPELSQKDLAGVQLIKSDFDTFNIERFYSFCRKSPIDGEDQSWAYPFVTLKNVNQEELDEFIIGTWIKNHESMADYQKQLDAISIK